MQRQLRTKYPVVLSGLLTLAVLLCLQYWGDKELLTLTRSGVLEGEFWRIFSGHLIHLNWQHLGLNIAGLVLCQFLFRLPWLHLLGTAVVAAIVIACGLYLFTTYSYYLGLSGVLHSWLMVGALLTLTRTQEKDLQIVSWAVIALVTGKVAFEQLASSELASRAFTNQFINGHIVTEAHFMGLAAGIFYFGILSIARVRTIFWRTRT
jgi:rhomboid family GlyGly-CTERM serine protease